MAKDEVAYREVVNVDEAIHVYRTQEAVSAETQALKLEAELSALDALPDGELQVAQERRQLKAQAEAIRKRADGLRKLAKMTDAKFPWPTVAGTLRQALATEEEMHIRAADQLEHHAAYNIAEDDASFTKARHEARMNAYASALDEVTAKIEDHHDSSKSPKPNQLIKGDPLNPDDNPIPDSDK